MELGDKYRSVAEEEGEADKDPEYEHFLQTGELAESDATAADLEGGLVSSVETGSAQLQPSSAPITPIASGTI